MKIEPFLISSSLNVIISQRLVRKSCEHCLEKMVLPVAIESAVVAELKRIPSQSMPKDISLTLPLSVQRGKGCPRCDGTGYRGRLAIAEVIEVTPRLQEIIATDELNQLHVMNEELTAQGMISIKQDGLMKALRGQTTIEEVLTSTQES